MMSYSQPEAPKYNYLRGTNFGCQNSLSKVQTNQGTVERIVQERDKPAKVVSAKNTLQYMKKELLFRVLF